MSDTPQGHENKKLWEPPCDCVDCTELRSEQSRLSPSKDFSPTKQEDDADGWVCNPINGSCTNPHCPYHHQQEHELNYKDHKDCCFWQDAGTGCDCWCHTPTKPTWESQIEQLWGEFRAHRENTHSRLVKLENPTFSDRKMFTPKDLDKAVAAERTRIAEAVDRKLKEAKELPITDVVGDQEFRDGQQSTLEAVLAIINQKK